MTSPGVFLFHAYTFIHCGGNNCAASTDGLSVKIKEGANDYREIFYAGSRVGRINDLQWIYNVTEFETDESEVLVSIIAFLFFYCIVFIK